MNAPLLQLHFKAVITYDSQSYAKCSELLQWAVALALYSGITTVKQTAIGGIQVQIFDA